MTMIFPGMDPYLENPLLWPGLNTAIIVYMADHLRPRLRSRYIASIEGRIFYEDAQRQVTPDVPVHPRRPEREQGTAAEREDIDAPEVVWVRAQEIHESYIAILDRQSGQPVVTVIEVVSPTNKYAGPGRDSYVSKQTEVLGSATHLVEIDLLRTGPHVLAVPKWLVRDRGPYAYLVCVNRAEGNRSRFEIYRRGFSDRLPRIPIPLADDDPDVLLDLQAVLSQTYEAGDYRDRLRYDSPCVPPLSPDDQSWADQLIREAVQPGA